MASGHCMFALASRGRVFGVVRRIFDLLAIVQSRVVPKRHSNSALFNRRFEVDLIPVLCYTAMTC